MTSIEMLSRVRSVTRDTAETFVLDDDIYDWLDEGSKDLAARLRILNATKTEADEAMGADDNTIGLPSAFLDLLTLRIGTDDVEIVSQDVFWAHVDAGSTLSRTIAMVFDGSLHLYPTPEAGAAYTMRYVRLPDTITASQDCELPESLHTKVVAYAKAESHYKLGDQAQGDRHLGIYESGLPEPSRDRTRLHPGPLSLTPEPGPFDVDPEARHL